MNSSIKTTLKFVFMLALSLAITIPLIYLSESLDISGFFWIAVGFFLSVGAYLGVLCFSLFCDFVKWVFKE